MIEKDPSQLESWSTQTLDLELPRHYELVVTTDRCVYSWTAAGALKLFRSAAGGVLVARRVGRERRLLAVADAELVVLHDTTRNSHEAYQLKSADVSSQALRPAGDRDANWRHEGHLRHLCYDEASHRLYFTTSLRNSVQSYALNDPSALDALNVHPSAPTCLGLSPTGELLVSASASPPVVLLQRLNPYAPAFQLQSRASSTAVTAAAFHPIETNIFALSFADGAIAIYDAKRLFHPDDGGQQRIGRARAGRSAEVGLFGSTRPGGLVPSSNSSDGPPTVAILQDCDIGSTPATIRRGRHHITAIAFLPSSPSRVVVGGPDGRCSVIDFKLTSGGEGRVVNTWHAHAPVNSLSVLLPVTRDDRDNDDRGERLGGEERVAEGVRVAEGSDGASEAIIAVGRADGKVAVYSVCGLLLAKRKFEDGGRGVIGVEWSKTPWKRRRGRAAELARRATSRRRRSSRTSILGPKGRGGGVMRVKSRKNEAVATRARPRIGSTSVPSKPVTQLTMEPFDGQQSSNWQDVSEREDEGSAQASKAKYPQRDTKGPPMQHLHISSVAFTLLGDNPSLLPETDPGAYRASSAAMLPKSLPVPALPQKSALRPPTKPKIKLGSSARRLSRSSVTGSSTNSFAKQLSALPRLMTHGTQSSGPRPTGRVSVRTKDPKPATDMPFGEEAGAPISPAQSGISPKAQEAGKRKRKSTRRAPKEFPLRRSSRRSSERSPGSKATSTSFAWRSAAPEHGIKIVRSGPGTVEQLRNIKHSVRPMVFDSSSGLRTQSSVSHFANAGEPYAPPPPPPPPPPPTVDSSVPDERSHASRRPGSEMVDSPSEFSRRRDINTTTDPNASVASVTNHLNPAVFDYLVRQSDGIRSTQESMQDDMGRLRQDLSSQVELQGQRLERVLTRQHVVLEQVLQDNDRLRNELATLWQNFLNHLRNSPSSSRGS